MRAGTSSDLEHQTPNSTDYCGLESCQFQSGSVSGSNEDAQEGGRDDGKEADMYEDDDRDYSL